MKDLWYHQGNIKETEKQIITEMEKKWSFSSSSNIEVIEIEKKTMPQMKEQWYKYRIKYLIAMGVKCCHTENIYILPNI